MRPAILSISYERGWWRGQVFWKPTTVRYTPVGSGIPVAVRRIRWLWVNVAVAEPIRNAP